MAQPVRKPIKTALSVSLFSSRGNSVKARSTMARSSSFRLSMTMSIRFPNLHFNRARRGQLDAAGPIDKQAGSTGLSRYQFLIVVLADIRYQPLLRSIKQHGILGRNAQKAVAAL